MSFLLMSALSNAQESYNAFFYPDSILINGKNQIIDTVSNNLSSNGKTRFIIWENELNKLSVLYKVKTSDKKLKTKSRIEIYKNGKWVKAKFRIRLIERRFLRMSRWTSKGKSTKSSRTLSMKTGFPVNRIFEGDNGDKIEIYGYFQTIWK